MLVIKAAACDFVTLTGLYFGVSVMDFRNCAASTIAKKSKEKIKEEKKKKSEKDVTLPLLLYLNFFFLFFS